MVPWNECSLFVFCINKLRLLNSCNSPRPFRGKFLKFYSVMSQLLVAGHKICPRSSRASIFRKKFVGAELEVIPEESEIRAEDTVNSVISRASYFREVPINPLPLLEKTHSFNVLIIGHSYVRDLIKSSNGVFLHNREFNFSFLRNQRILNYSVPGSTFYSWNKKQILETVKRCLFSYRVDCIVVCLGGNDFNPKFFAAEGNPIQPVIDEIKKFFINLKSKFPSSKIIFVEVEPRCYTDKFKHSGAPTISDFRKFSKYINKYMHRRHWADRLAILGNKTRGITGSECFKRDGVHLNELGLARLWFSISSALKLALL